MTEKEFDSFWAKTYNKATKAPRLAEGVKLKPEANQGKPLSFDYEAEDSAPFDQGGEVEAPARPDDTKPSFKPDQAQPAKKKKKSKKKKKTKGKAQCVHVFEAGICIHCGHNPRSV